MIRLNIKDKFLIFIILIVLINFAKFYLSGSVWHDYPLESHINFSSVNEFLETGIPVIPYWENSSLALDQLNYMTLGKVFIDSLIFKLLKIDIQTYYYVYFVEYLFFIIVLFRLSKNINTQIFKYLFILLLLIDGLFSNLIRVELAYGVGFSLLAAKYLLEEPKKSTTLLAGIFSCLAAIFFIMLGILLISSVVIYQLIELKNGKNKLKDISYFFIGLFIPFIVINLWLTYFLNFQEISNIINIIFLYIANSSATFLTFERLESYLIIFSDLFFSYSGVSILTPLLLIFSENLFNFKNLDKKHQRLVKFIICSLCSYFILAVFFPLHFYGLRLSWILPFLLISFFINLEKNSNINFKFLIFLAFCYYLEQNLFHYMVRDYFNTSIKSYILINALSTLTLFFIIIVNKEKIKLLISAPIKQNIPHTKITLLTLICFSLIFLSNSFITLNQKLNENILENNFESIIDLRKNIQELLSKKEGVNSIITNWPMEFLFDKKYKLHGYDSYMIHKKSRKFLHGVPSKTPKSVVLIFNQNKEIDGFSPRVININSKSDFAKPNKSIKDHTSIYIKGHTFILKQKVNTKKYLIYYYEYTSLLFEDVDLYLDILHPSEYQNYIQEYEKI